MKRVLASATWLLCSPSYDMFDGTLKGFHVRVHPSGAESQEIAIAEFEQLFGATLGRQLAGDDLVLGTLTGSILGTIGLNIGQSIDAANNLQITYTDKTGLQYTRDAAYSVWSDFNNELVLFTANAAIGSPSSWLALELGEALGLEGFWRGDVLDRRRDIAQSYAEQLCRQSRHL